MAAPEVSALLDAPSVDAVLVDARRDLVGARGLCRLLRTTGVSVPLLAVLTEGGLVACSADWGVDDVLLGTAGTGIAFLWFYTLIADIGPARATIISYITPGFSVVYGVVLLGEPFSLAAVGGLDAENLAVAFNDVDLCLRLRAAGYRILWTPFAELYHLESASRGQDVSAEKARRFAGELAAGRDL